MKRFLVAVCSLVVILNACSKDDDNPVDGGNNNTNTTPASAFAVKINGQAWTADTVYVMKYALNTSKWDITAEKGQTFLGSRISMVIPSKEKGTYTVDASDILKTYLVYAPNFQTPYASREGQVTITESTDNYVKGTFNFTTTDQNTNTVNHTLSEGSFTAHIRK